VSKQFHHTAVLGVIAVLVLLGSIDLCAQGTGNLFRKANDAYTRGDFNAARELYQRILDEEGVKSPEIYYNLGNAYYRLGKPGRALLWWERALKSLPRDKDTRFNISFVCSRLFSEKEEQKALDIILSWLARAYTLDEMAIACAVIYCAGALFLIGYIFLKRPVLLKFAVISGVALCIFCAWLFILYRHTVGMRRGIIVAPKAEVHNGPDESFKVGFTAGEGREALLLRESGGWQEIGIPGKGLKGWVKKEMVEEI